MGNSPSTACYVPKQYPNIAAASAPLPAGYGEAPPTKAAASHGAQGAVQPSQAPLASASVPLRARSWSPIEMVEVNDETMLWGPDQAAALARQAESYLSSSPTARPQLLASSFGSKSSGRCAKYGPGAPPPRSCVTASTPAGSAADGAPADAKAGAQGRPAPLGALPERAADDLWRRNCDWWLEDAEAALAAEAPGPLSEEELARALSDMQNAAEAVCSLGRNPAMTLDLSLPAFGRLDRAGGAAGVTDDAGGAAFGGGPWDGGGGGETEVFQGLFKNAPAAVKVMYTWDRHDKAVAHATQMAVLSCVQHPYIVRAYACLPDMARLPDGPAPATLARRAGARALRFEGAMHVDAFEVDDAAACDVLVTELCDAGALRDLLARAAPGSPGTQQMLLPLLLDVAAALRHLHSLRIAHGGVEPSNVLLCSDPSRPLGLSAKLGGFGRARILGRPGAEVDPLEAVLDAIEEAEAAAPSSWASSYDYGCGGGGGGRRAEGGRGGGAAAALPKEQAPPATHAGDVFDFGALLCECIPAGAACGPRSPLALLAADCCAADAAARPCMEAVAARLEELAYGA